MCISNDSKMAITITKESERASWVKMYCLESQTLKFQERIGGGEQQYIKLKEIEQTDDGQMFAIAYFDDGKFRLRTFAQPTALQRSESEISKNEVDINKEMGIDDWTMAI